ncbi:MAG: hypothetical protein HQK53_01180 [Oligoflexia bacterium]|nr:hypothetical protein [Oligoflexia bacterium]
MKIEVSSINIVNEKSLHEGIKRWYYQPGDRIEVRVRGKIIDLVRDELLVEIQTKNLYAIKDKLAQLLPYHPVKVIYPIAVKSDVITLDKQMHMIRQRKSPKKGHPLDIFDELCGSAHLVAHPNFSLLLLFIQQADLRLDDGKGSWRRKGVSLLDRKLLGVIGQQELRVPADYLNLLPSTLPSLFTNQELSSKFQLPYRRVSKITYCFKKMGLIAVTGKNGRSLIYTRLTSTTLPLK